MQQSNFYHPRCYTTTACLYCQGAKLRAARLDLKALEPLFSGINAGFTYASARSDIKVRRHDCQLVVCTRLALKFT